MKCLLDMDGVLVDFVKGACRHHGKTDPYVEYKEFYFYEAWGMSAEEFWKGMGYDFWSNLPWTSDGRKIFNIVDKVFGPKNTCILTRPCETYGCLEGKREWIKEHLPVEYHRRFLMGPVKDMCANENHVLIDDHDKNIKDFIASGGQGLLLPRPWNKNRIIETEAWLWLDMKLNEAHYGQ